MFNAHAECRLFCVAIKSNMLGCHCAECHCAECHCAECHCAECHCAECHCAECHSTVNRALGGSTYPG